MAAATPTRLRALASCVRGTSVVELGIAAPLLAAMIIGIVDVSRGVAYKLKMQQAAARGLEMTAIGQTGTADSDIKSTVATGAGVSQSNVVITRTLECNGAAVAADVTSCGAGEETARYIEVRVTGTFTPLFRYSSLAQTFPGLQADGTVQLSARAVSRVQ